MRLVAQAKCGFYPTPENVTPIICRYLARQGEGIVRVLDPCAGEGTALKVVGDHLKAETYGIELDRKRGETAKGLLDHCLITDYQNTRIAKGAFSLLWLNPPYDWSAKDSDIETSERYERTFLRDCWPYLCPGGVLVYLIPQRRLDRHIARILAYRFENIGVYRFPETEYQAFKQLAVFGRLKNKPDKDDQVSEYLHRVGRQEAVVPFLPEEPARTYVVPPSSGKGTALFKSKDIDLDELAADMEQHGVFGQFEDLTTPLVMTEKIRPIMPLRHGHLAQILACGLMNGVVRDQDGDNPLLVKGVTKKEVIYTVEQEGDKEKHIETDHIKIVIKAFNRQGELLTIE